MRLPKSAWRLLRSKRFHRFLIIAPFALLLGAAALYWGINEWGSSELEASRARLEVLGVSTTTRQADNPATSAQSSILELPELVSLGSYDSNPDVLLAKAGATHADCWDFFTGDGPLLPGEMRIFFPKAPPDTTDVTLAKQLLGQLATAGLKLQAPIEAMNDPSFRVGSSLDPPPFDEFQTLSNTAYYLAIRSVLHAKAGDISTAIDDFTVLTNFALRWQDEPGDSLHMIRLYGLLSSIGHAAPILVEAAAIESPAALDELDEALASIDRLDPLLRSTEFDLSLWFHEFFNDHHSATTLPASEMHWGFDWDDDWKQWCQTLDDWWWQVRPVGLFKAEMSKAIDYHLTHFSRTPSGALRDRPTLEDALSYERFLESMGSFGSDTGFFMHPNVLKGAIPEHIKFHFTRLAIACERYRAVNGEFPKSLDGLVPNVLLEPIHSPVLEGPVTMGRTPEGRLYFETHSLDPDEPHRFEYPIRR